MPNFIDDDENIILFDDRFHPISREGFEMVASSGVRTAIKNLEWIFAEPTPGHYDWSEPDEFVENCTHSGMKALLITPSCVAACMPDGWYCQSESGGVHRNFPTYSVFSPWNSEAQEYQDKFVEMVIARYSSYKVQAIRGGSHGGEMILTYEPGYFDPKAIESFRAWANNKFYGNLSAFNNQEKTSYSSWEQVKPGTFPYGRLNQSPITNMWLREHLINQIVHQQSILVNHYGGEAWMMLAHCWQDIIQTGNFLIPDATRIIMERVHPTQVNWIAFAHFNLSVGLQTIALGRIKDGAKLWAGSQYCEGLPLFTARAKASGIRGFLTGPLSSEDGHYQEKIEPWMVENFKKSIAYWRTQ